MLPAHLFGTVGGVKAWGVICLNLMLVTRIGPLLHLGP